VLSIEQRVKIVEERMADHSQLFMDIRQSLLQFEARVDRRFEQVESRLTGLDQKIDGLGQTLGTELLAVRRDMTAQFRWTAGIMLTGLVAIDAALLAQ
jgi:phosphoglycerate-specific signal transduction histidine kinase